jgi:hypothetical protein
MLDLMDAAIDQLETVVGAQLTAEGVDAVFNSGRLNAPASTPAIDIYPGAGRDTDTSMFSDSFDGGGYLFTVRARLSSNDYDENQRILYELMDDTGNLSLAQALDDEPTLGGLAASINCVDPSGEVIFQDPGSGPYYGFQFTLRVLPAYS